MDLETIRDLYAYNRWANARALEAASAVSARDFTKEVGGSFASLRGTLAHMYGAEWIWLERWKGISPPRLPDEGEFPDILELRGRWKAIEEHRDSWFKNLSEAGVRQKIRYRNLEGKSFEAPLWQLMQHVANHSTYHRGQVVAMLRMLGAKAVSTDLVLWDRERVAKARR